jgi:PAS domain S-box-containing protein
MSVPSHLKQGRIDIGDLSVSVRPPDLDFLTAVFRDAHQPIIIKDRSSRFLYLNRAACDLIGQESDRTFGRTDFDFLPREEAKKIKAVDEDVFATGEERLFEERITTSDGIVRTLVTHKRRAVLPCSDVILIATISDITELRETERGLRESEQHCRSLIELHPQVLWVANAEGNVVEVGPGWRKVSGRPPEDAIGTGWARSIYPLDLRRVKRLWAAAVVRGTPFDAEFRVMSVDGDHRWFRGRAAPERDSAGRVVRWYGLLEDVHDRQLALRGLQESEKKLRQHRDELEQIVKLRTAEVERKSADLDRLLQQEREVNALQRRFVSMISHEFRTPLSIIDAAARRLTRSKKELTADYLAEKTRQITGAVSRMVELMESILAAGRLQTGTIAIRKEKCSLFQLIEDCVSRRSEISPSHPFVMDLEALPEFVVADKDAMERVFINLLSNAVKYSPGKPDIHIRGWIDDGEVKITVRDEGVGMDAEDIPKLFQPYFRARSAVGIAGTGIGLNIAREIVELHGGTITVCSTLGRGTIFTVVLPASCTEAAAEKAA